ncbi:MAG: tripartite tricarboxylate transporter substrate binding protein [Burkholderiales bacterium]|nr:tripartite tricarboxylate transporter substrate binding protein [Burkholderiales bacterium]
MNGNTRRGALARFGALLLAGVVVPARAQLSSAHPLKLVVPYGTGGAPDILARLFATELAGAYGSVVVENKGGAGGTVGADLVAKAAPDSGVLLVTTAATHVINPYLYPNFPYDPVRDFTPVALVASTPLMLVTSAQGPYKSLADVLAAARAKPDALSYASAGNGTMQHIAGALMESIAQVQATHVPYKGSGQVMPDLIAGRVSIMFNSVAAVGPLVKSGQLRALAVTTRERLPAWPEVPTMAEAGLPGFEANAWYAVFGPRGMPPAEVQKAQRELARALDLPAVKERYAVLGLEPLRGGPAELAAVVQRDGQKWSVFLRERGIRSTD